MIKNKNCCLVKPRQDRLCYFCGSKIEKGTECLSVNSIGQGRRWFCLDCVEELNNKDDYYWDDGKSSNGL